MGVMRFQLPSSRIDGTAPALYRAYISGFDGRVYPTRVEVAQGTLLCRRTTSDSGRLNVAWPVEGFGSPVLSTASLMEREQPYHLAVELARGKICQLRDQMGAWQVAGMMMPEEVLSLSREAHAAFAQAASNQIDADASTRLAEKALLKACEAADLVTRSYSRQRLNVRRRKGGGLPTFLGCDPGVVSPAGKWTERFREAFTAAVVPIRWSHIEPEEGEYDWSACDALADWARECRLTPFGGPLLDFGPHGLPRWLEKWEHDFFNLQSFLSDFVETAIGRYIGRIRYWEVATRANTGGGMALTEENRLMLVARVLETAKQVDEDLQLMIRIDQPWGDYQARGQHQLTPIQFVDALLRSGVGLSGVNLEIAVGYRPRGTAPRDLLDFSRLLDQWGGLGLPINVQFAFPATVDVDPRSDSDLEVDQSQADGWSEAKQAEWVDRYLPLTMSKQGVTGVFWSHFQEGVPHHFPNAGLLRADLSPRPAFGKIVQLRKDYLKGDDRRAGGDDEK